MIAVHAEPGIPWHMPFAHKMMAGLDVLGLPAFLTASRSREADIAILLGTSMWRAIEADGRYLLVDRCSFNDTNHYVSLVWNGHGRRGDHKVPNLYGESRWNIHHVPLAPMRPPRDEWSAVLCGQYEAYSPEWTLDQFYAAEVDYCDCFRPHPMSDNPTRLPTKLDWSNVWLASTLNSSVAIAAIIEGINAYVMDAGGMAYGWHEYARRAEDSRLHLLHWLAWTQWHHEEIERGVPIRHLFEDV